MLFFFANDQKIYIINIYKNIQNEILIFFFRRIIEIIFFFKFFTIFMIKYKKINIEFQSQDHFALLFKFI